jgi:hypothetical protein
MPHTHARHVRVTRVSIGSLGKNRTTDMVENVRVDTCLLTNTTNGVRIKSWQVINTTRHCVTTVHVVGLHSDRSNLVREAWGSRVTCGSRTS